MGGIVSNSACYRAIGKQQYCYEIINLKRNWDRDWLALPQWNLPGCLSWWWSWWWPFSMVYLSCTFFFPWPSLLSSFSIIQFTDHMFLSAHTLSLQPRVPDCHLPGLCVFCMFRMVAYKQQKLTAEVKVHKKGFQHKTGFQSSFSLCLHLHHHTVPLIYS